MKKLLLLSIIANLIFASSYAQNIGIGTLNPQAKLEIKNRIQQPTFMLADSFQNLAGQLRFRSLLPAYNNKIWGMDFKVGSDLKDYEFGINRDNTNVMKLYGTGNITIGSSITPKARLSVKSNDPLVDILNIVGSGDEPALKINANGNIGIKNIDPKEALDIKGNMRADIVKTDGLQITPNAGAGKILTSDAAGIATWQTSTGSGAGWLLTGNAGTNASVNFLGTTDNKPLQFKVNNIRAGYIGTLANNGNVFWGYQSGLNTTGHSNIGLGTKALFSNTTESNLIAIGDSALYNNTTGIFNTAVGSKALYSNNEGSSNTAIGISALYSNTTGVNNTANGFSALSSNTEGRDNTANGSGALGYNGTGSENTANGSAALYTNQTGEQNTANGVGALYSNESGSGNIASGVDALHSNTTGPQNTANGYNALYSNIEGGYNTANGSYALYSNTTGSGNTALGFGADVSSGNLSNSTALGNGAIVNTSNKVRIGNNAVTVIEGKVAYSFPSDARFKYNIQNNVPGLDFIKLLTPVTYYFDEEKLTEYTKTGIINNSILKPASYKEKQLHTGFLAQDVEKIVRELGYSFDGIHAPANDKDHYSLAYSQFIMPLVKSVQEQQEIINSQAEQIKIMNEKIETLVKAVEALTQKEEVK
ncbi:MAG: tail fiber domain-containing protein [Ginsengibacter sp.]